MTYIIIAIATLIVFAIIATPVWADFKAAQAIREYEKAVWY